MADTRETLANLLKQAATDHLGRLENEIRPRLNARELHLLDWLVEQYQDDSKKRWYDPYHILYSTNFALDLANTEELDRLIVSGIILHDIGDFAIVDKTQWSHPHSRITHMQEGTALAAKILVQSGYTAPELEKILGMIAVHDNPYIGIEIQGRDRLGLRDCDRVWVMHILSFYKDITSKFERYNQPQAFLHDRMTQFYGWDQPFGDDWTVTLAHLKKNAQRLEPPTYALTKQVVKRQFGRRIRELQDENLLQNVDIFKTLLDAQIENE